MSITADADVRGAASHRHMADHLTAPLQAGTAETEVPITAAGHVELGATRHPLVLAATRSPLDGKALELTVDRPDGSSSVLDFAVATEAGASLPLHVPPADPATGLAAALSLRLRLVVIHDPQRGTGREVVPVAQIGQHIAVRLVEGITGRVLYLLGAEKQRLRRQARELAGVRTLAGAHGDALDRIGTELGVSRLGDTISFREATPEEGPSIFGQFDFGERRFGPGIAGEITAVARREPDDEYRRRLAIYRGWLYPSRRQIATMLNGPGADTAPNAGLLGAMGVTERVLVDDRAPDAATAIHLVAVGDPAVRAGFADLIRRTVLVWPAASTEADAAHAARYLPARVAADVNALRVRLRTVFAVPAGLAIAPGLAAALDRFGRCLRALRFTGQWPLAAGQDLSRGSRYLFGLGADVGAPAATLLGQLVTRVRAGDFLLPAAPTATEPDPAETRARLRAAAPRDVGDDPDGAWLFEACGLRTVHAIAADRLYVSPVPTSGLTIAGPANATTAPVALESGFLRIDEPGAHRLLARSVVAALTTWTGLGHAAWTPLKGQAALDAWAAGQVTPEPARDVLVEVGFPTITNPAAMNTGLRALPVGLLSTFRLPVAEARRITLGRPDAVEDLAELVAALGEQGIASGVLLVLGDENVVIVAGGVALPQAGVNVAERTPTPYRWYTTRIWPAAEETTSTIEPEGPQVQFTPGDPGLYAVVSRARVRGRAPRPAPYELAVDLPAGATLDLLQYEYLMNLLAHVHPAGTRVDTATIRRAHVDLDDDGVAEPMPASLSGTFRQFRRPRPRRDHAT